MKFKHLFTFDRSFCGVVNLILIMDRGIWNSHLMLITSMTVYQLMLDVAHYPLGIYNPHTEGYSINFVLVLFGGASSAFVSNVMIWSMLYISLYMETLDLKGNVILVNFLSCILGLFFVLLYIISEYDTNVSSSASSFVDAGPDIYTYFRLASIAFNILVLAYIRFLLYSLKRASSQEPTTLFRIRVMSAVVHRLEYYPVVQSISRIGYAWYDLSYGYDFVISSATDPLKVFVAYLSMTLGPLAAGECQLLCSIIYIVFN